MIAGWRKVVAKVRRVFQLVVLFCVLRIVVGVGAILLFDRGAVAWGPELTAVVVAALVVYVGVALVVRRYAARPASGR